MMVRNNSPKSVLVSTFSFRDQNAIPFACMLSTKSNKSFADLLNLENDSTTIVSSLITSKIWNIIIICYNTLGGYFIVFNGGDFITSNLRMLSLGQIFPKNGNGANSSCYIATTCCYHPNL